MSFTVSDLQGFLTLLREHPEWRDAVRHEILTDDLLALPGIMREIASALHELAEAQARTETQLAHLTE